MVTSTGYKRSNSAGPASRKVEDDDDFLPPLPLNFAKTEAPGLKTLQLAKSDERPEYSVYVNVIEDS